MSIKEFINSVKINFSILFLVFIISLGFLFSVISIYLGFEDDDNFITPIIRKITYLLAFISICICFSNNLFSIKIISKNFYYLIIFYLYYIVVIYFDLYINKSNLVWFSARESSSIIIRMTQLVLLPTFASLIFRIKYLNQKKIVFAIFITQFIAMSLSLIILDLTIGQLVDEQLKLSGELNSLNLGYGAVTLFVLCVFAFFKYNKFTTRIFSLSGGILSLYVIIISGSRGPLIYSFLILLYCIYFSNYNKNIKRFIVFIVVILILIFFVNYTIFTDVIGNYSSELENRLISSIDNNEISGRESLYKIGLNQFLENPFFGNYFVLTSGNYKGEYPHNIILEAFMTFGLFGAIPFIILLYKTFVRVNLMVKNNLDIFWIGLLFLISFFKGLSTWNLYGNTLLWLSMGIILTYKIENLKDR